MKIDELQEGMTLNNNELMDTFLCSPQGGCVEANAQILLF